MTIQIQKYCWPTVLTSLLLSIICFATPHKVFAEEPDEDVKVVFLDQSHSQANTIIVSAAEWFDSFFDDSRFRAEENKTRVQLRIINRYHEEDGYDFRPSIRWWIHLPKLSNKLQLIVFAADDDEVEAEKEGFTGPDTSEDNFDDNFAAAIRYFITESEKYNISTSFGGSYDYLYAGLRFRYYRDLGSWESRFVDRLRYYTDDGWENKVSLDLERRISEKWLFRTSGELYLKEETDNINHNFRFQLYQFLTDEKALSYEWHNLFVTEPSHKRSDTILKVRYRQRFYRDWMMIEVAPQVNFPEEDDNDAQYGITVSLEAKFGKKEQQKLKNIFRF